MVDLDRIHQRLQLLAGYLRELRRLHDLPVAEYLRHEVYAGRYLVQVAAQTCIDLANHIIASEGWRAPHDLADWMGRPWGRRKIVGAILEKTW